MLISRSNSQRRTYELDQNVIHNINAKLNNTGRDVRYTVFTNGYCWQLSKRDKTDPYVRYVPVEFFNNLSDLQHWFDQNDPEAKVNLFDCD